MLVSAIYRSASGLVQYCLRLRPVRNYLTDLAVCLFENFLNESREASLAIQLPDRDKELIGHNSHRSTFYDGKVAESPISAYKQL